MKYAIIGKGKTGGKVIELLAQKKAVYEVFDSSNVATAEKLKEFDVVICFVPGPSFESLIPTLLEAKIAVVTGATGFDWPLDMQSKLESNNSAWLFATNFSIGMNLVHNMIETLSKADRLFSDYKFELHEVHHTKKVDSPSGTAKTWGEWLNLPVDITAERTGDVVGDHQLTFTTDNEKITLRHEALDRKIFAAGALWAADKISDLAPGLHSFEDITLKELLK
jgi:4-hydroxy-tetrahydrodipicolinate reductase